MNRLVCQAVAETHIDCFPIADERFEPPSRFEVQIRTARSPARTRAPRPRSPARSHPRARRYRTAPPPSQPPHSNARAGPKAAEEAADQRQRDAKIQRLDAKIQRLERGVKDAPGPQRLEELLEIHLLEQARRQAEEALKQAEEANTEARAKGQRDEARSVELERANAEYGDAARQDQARLRELEQSEERLRTRGEQDRQLADQRLDGLRFARSLREPPSHW